MDPQDGDIRPRRGPGALAAPGATRGDRRRALRYRLSLPAALGGRAGRLRDYSASGFFVETEASYAPGAPIAFSLVLGRLRGGAPLVLRGEGRVIRTERRGGRAGLAAEVITYR